MATPTALRLESIRREQRDPAVHELSMLCHARAGRTALAGARVAAIWMHCLAARSGGQEGTNLAAAPGPRPGGSHVDRHAENRWQAPPQSPSPQEPA